MKKGFTLMEMALILVILGVIAGGIIAAGSMLGASKVSGQVRQLSEFEAGTATFISKQKYMPGDARASGGDGDGLLEDQYFANLNSTIANGEIGWFWRDWNPDKYTAITSGTVNSEGSGTKHAPPTIIGMKGSRWLASALSSNNFSINTTRGNWYFMVPSYSPTASGGMVNRFPQHTAENSPMTPADLHALDTKIDDRIANSGIVQASHVGDGGGGAPGHGAIGATPLATCAVTTTYQITQTGFNCTPIVRIGGLNGDPR